MIKQIAWNTFKNTGNIDTFLELMQVQDAEKDILIDSVSLGEINGNNQNQGDNNFRK